MGCIDAASVISTVTSRFWTRFNAEFPAAYENEKKSQMQAAFDGRSLSVNCSMVEYWTGEWSSDSEWNNPAGGHWVWHGERHSAQITNVTLKCDGENIEVDEISVDVSTIGTMDDFYEKNNGE